MDPLILLYSGFPHGFLFCKLKISLSKITNLHFRSVPCLKFNSKPRVVISSEIVCGSFHTDFHSQNYQFRCLTIIKESLFDLGCLLPSVNEILK